VSITNSDSDPAANLLVGNIITGNKTTAYDGGGGVFVHQSIVTLDGNVIAGNVASGQYSGGGGLCAKWLSAVTMINNLVADNQVDNAGSGVYVEESSLRMLHTTIAGNMGGDGSGVYTPNGHPSYPSTVALTNTIIVSQTVGVRSASGDMVRLEATLWGDGIWANGTDWAGPGTVLTGTVNFWGDPGFLDPATGGYHLGPGSEALDRGIDAGVAGDIDGQPRPYQAPDLGADEYWPPGVLKYLYLPLTLRPGP
jgi:hypothetical protein